MTYTAHQHLAPRRTQKEEDSQIPLGRAVHVVEDHPLEVRRPSFIQPEMVPARTPDKVSCPAVTVRVDREIWFSAARRGANGREDVRDFMGADVCEASVVCDQDGCHKRQTRILHPFPINSRQSRLPEYLVAR